MKARGLLLALAGLWAGALQAGEIHLCMTEREFLPVNSMIFEAPGQYLVRLAIEKQGDKVVFTGLPWRRCVDGLRHGDYDGAIGMAATDSYYTFMRFPMAGGKADEAESVGNLAYVVARPKNGAADWDGERFRGLTQPVLYNAPSLVLADKMHRLGAGNANTSLGEDQMLAMMLAGRADIAIGRKDVFEALLATDAFRGKVELLPIPFVDTASYLAFRQGFKDPSPGYAQRVWDEIGRQQAAADWPEIRQRLLVSRSRSSRD